MVEKGKQDVLLDIYMKRIEGDYVNEEGKPKVLELNKDLKVALLKKGNLSESEIVSIITGAWESVEDKNNLGDVIGYADIYHNINALKKSKVVDD